MSGYLNTLTQYAPTLAQAISTANTLVTSTSSFLKDSNTDSAGNKTKEAWVDPVCGLLALAVLNAYPSGTKIAFYDNDIIFDQPGLLQPYIRRSRGSSRSDLYNLTPSIFYATQWLNPHENPQNQRIFRLAQESIQSIIRTYEGDRATQQYLTATHLRMLKDAIAGTELSREDFFIPNLAGHPLMENSKKYWSGDGCGLTSLHKTFESMERQSHVSHRDAIEEKIHAVNNMHKNYLAKVLAGLDVSSSDDTEGDFDFNVIVAVSKRKKSGSVGSIQEVPEISDDEEDLVLETSQDQKESIDPEPADLPRISPKNLSSTALEEPADLLIVDSSNQITNNAQASSTSKKNKKKK